VHEFASFEHGILLCCRFLFLAITLVWAAGGVVSRSKTSRIDHNRAGARRRIAWLVSLLHRTGLLLAQNGRSDPVGECPLLGVRYLPKRAMGQRRIGCINSLHHGAATGCIIGEAKKRAQMELEKSERPTPHNGEERF
jgi:hypothetical protein